MAFDVKNTTKMHVLDLLFPYSCRGCGKIGKILCCRCKKYIKKYPIEINADSDLEWVVAAGRREGLLKQLIVEYKYEGRRGAAEVLTDFLVRALVCRGEFEELKRRGLVIVPLPTIRRHIRERGFDHTKKMTRLMARKLGLKSEDLLLRVNNTVQVGADEKKRVLQARSAYSVNQKLIQSRRVKKCQPILLVDDVWTTGASMKATAKILKKNGFKKVYGIVIVTGLSAN